MRQAAAIQAYETSVVEESAAQLSGSTGHSPAPRGADRGERDPISSTPRHGAAGGHIQQQQQHHGGAFGGDPVASAEAALAAQQRQVRRAQLWGSLESSCHAFAAKFLIAQAEAGRCPLAWLPLTAPCWCGGAKQAAQRLTVPALLGRGVSDAHHRRAHSAAEGLLLPIVRYWLSRPIRRFSSALQVQQLARQLQRCTSAGQVATSGPGIAPDARPCLICGISCHVYVTVPGISAPLAPQPSVAASATTAVRAALAQVCLRAPCHANGSEAAG